MIPVTIIGTPMKFTIEEKLAAIELPLPSHESLPVYVPGKVVQHTGIGPLKCEEFDVSPDDVRKIQGIRCSIMDHKTKQGTPTKMD
jgi:hypothetical protein